jgi:hypothetical protein
LICSFNFLIFLAVCLNISTVINIKILTNSNQQTQSHTFTSHIAAFLSVVLIIEMLEICIQTSYDQNVQLNLKSYLPVVYGNPLRALNYTFITQSNTRYYILLLYGSLDLHHFTLCNRWVSSLTFDYCSWRGMLDVTFCETSM